MTSSYSPGVVLVSQIAALETLSGGHECIEREHLFIGLAKAESTSSELDAGLIESKMGDPQTLKQEMQYLGDCFRDQNVDVEKARRRARHLVGTGNANKGEHKTMHRSLACRDAFARAAEFASQRAIATNSLHLLAGLLAQPGVLVAQSVAFSGGDLEKLREAAMKAMAEYTPPASPAMSSAPAAGVLGMFGVDLTKLASEGKIEPIIGRKKELLQLLRAISRKTKNNPLLLGEPGVGKTALVHALAHRIIAGKVPAGLADTRIVEIKIGAMLAGAKYRGEFEERLTGLIAEAKARPEVILFLDEIHTIVGAGAAVGGLDAANILKPALSSGELRCIGSTTVSEYRKYFERDSALSRRFLPVVVAEPTPEETLNILEGLRERYEKHHGVRIAPSALRTAVEFSVRYIPERHLPDKALDLLDEACVRVKISSTTFHADEEGVEQLAVVSSETVALVIAEQTGIPVARLTSDARQKLQGMQESLSRRVVGQPAAVEKVTRMVTMARAGLRNPNRPLGVLLFVGPTGVGKTELSRALAEFLFGSEREMIRFDMSEFKEKHSASRLIGAPPGYIGHDEEGELTGRLRSKPYSVVLFDEIEKAHPEILDLFLQLFDSARITDSHGRTVDARNAIFIMTCNAVEPSRRLGFRAAEESLPGPLPSDPEESLNLLIKELGTHFRREFLNRTDEIVLFDPLTAESIRQIANSLLERLAESIRSQGHTVEFTSEAVDLIARKGCDPKNGARPIARAIDRLIAGPLSQELILENIAPGDHLTVGVHDGKLVFLRSTREDDSVHTT